MLKKIIVLTASVLLGTTSGVSIANTCLPYYQGLSFQKVDIYELVNNTRCSYAGGLPYYNAGPAKPISGPWKELGGDLQCTASANDCVFG